MREVQNLVCIHTQDPNLPGTLYLTDDGDLTKDPFKARRVEDSKLHKAMREIKKYSTKFFIRTVTE